MCYSWAPPAFASLYPLLWDMAPNTLFPSASSSRWTLSSMSVCYSRREPLDRVLQQDWGRTEEEHAIALNKTVQIWATSLLVGSSRLCFLSWILWFLLESPSKSPGFKKEVPTLQKKELFNSLRILLPHRRCLKQFLHITAVLKTTMCDGHVQVSSSPESV